MALLEVYQGNNKTISVNLTNDDGTPYNASGAILFYTARQNYVDNNYLWNISATGLGADLNNAITGLMVLNLTSKDTNICPGDYPAAFTFSGVDNSVSTFGTDGVSVLPAPLILI